jgi:hypothetical protein
MIATFIPAVASLRANGGPAWPVPMTIASNAVFIRPSWYPNRMPISQTSFAALLWPSPKRAPVSGLSLHRPIDIEIQHRHGGLKRRSFAALAAASLKRSAESSAVRKFVAQISRYVFDISVI